MSVGSPSHSNPTDQYTWLPKGTRLWHVYPDGFDCLAFNAKSTNRFALPPPPACAMFYAGDSADCALWESVLRNLVINSAQPQPVDPGLLAGRSIVELEVALDTKILDLRAPYFRKFSSDPALHAELQRLAVVPDAQYAETHAKARALRDEWTDAVGLCWFSRQIGAQRAYVFYRPPHPAGGFRKIQAHSLDTAQGWALIDAALDVVGVKRLGATL
ncbi:RES family NAD+ phosphorylase [Steroidobacter sp.]|uniref:RES family NAD+ phosphorylase n=1 Tax=Steroidobacter sp. TaxID=1978227 RepID=UPI001A3E3B38|nr:RES family NAD+ phosphorylase [Steroidobacter sp.]MBL8266297.1 RES family NAD+ phosphorylase [Steroidobacter sp.]